MRARNWVLMMILLSQPFIGIAHEKNPVLALDVELAFLPLRFGEKELMTRRYYTLYDLDVAHGSVHGFVTVRALPGPGRRYPRFALSTPQGDWTRYLSMRLFRDEIELLDSEFEVSFEPSVGPKPAVTRAAGPPTVDGTARAMAEFELTGRGGEPLYPGLYRLWVILDVRDLPASEGAFRGWTVSEYDAYMPRFDPDPARKGGLVFTLQAVGDDPDLRASYLLQRISMEEARRVWYNLEPADDEKAAAAGLSVLDLARQGLEIDPQNGDFLLAAGRALTRMGNCEAAIPYFVKAFADPDAMRRMPFRDEYRIHSCMTAAISSTIELSQE